MGQFVAGLGLLLSPRALAAVGQGLAAAGGWFWLAWPLLVAVFWISAGNLAILLQQGAAGGRIFAGRGPSLTGEIALGVCLAGRLGLYLFFSASLLGLAGYAFNEIVWRAFPNLAFSFCLLGLVVAVNLLRDEAAMALQVMAAGLSCAGLLLLAVAGFFAASPAPQPALAHGGPLAVVAGLLPLLAGFDLGRFAPVPRQTPAHREDVLLSLRLALLAGAVLLGLWALVTMRLVEPQRLAESTVPHLLAARRILGGAGRTVMGAVIVCGALAGVQALLWSVALPADPDRFTRRPRQRQWSVALLGLALATLLALGFAGEPVTEALIAGSLALLLAGYGLCNIVRLATPRELGRGSLGRVLAAQAGLGCLLLAFAALWSSHRPVVSLGCAALLALAGVLARLAWKNRLPA